MSLGILYALPQAICYLKSLLKLCWKLRANACSILIPLQAPWATSHLVSSSFLEGIQTTIALIRTPHTVTPKRKISSAALHCPYSFTKKKDFCPRGRFRLTLIHDFLAPWLQRFQIGKKKKKITEELWLDQPRSHAHFWPNHCEKEVLWLVWFGSCVHSVARGVSYQPDCQLLA